MPRMTGEPFWRRKTLEQMTAREWESLCDGCGLCCLVRFEDEDSGEVIPTRVHCKLFDPTACTCADYANRRAHVPDCVKLTPGNIEALPWMPKSCAYRRLHRAGVSVRGQTVSEEVLAEAEDALEFAAWDLIDERGRD
jgi:hypothetical protein